MALNQFQIINHKVAGTTFSDTDICLTPESSSNYKCFGFPYEQNVTIGGCSTFLLAPVGLTFDAFGYLFVVNNAFPAAPGFVTVYPSATYGDVLPAALIGLIPGSSSAGDLDFPAAVAVATSGSPGAGDVVYVSDIGLPRVLNKSGGQSPVPATPASIKFFAPFDPATCFTAFYPIGCTGTLLGSISGPHTKLRHPEGIALSQDADTLYVVNQFGNTLEMFTGVIGITATGGVQDVAPTLVISGPNSKMNMPVGVALPQFTPTPAPTATATATATATPTATSTPIIGATGR